MNKKQIEIPSSLLEDCYKGFITAIILIVIIHFFADFSAPGNGLGQESYNYQLNCPFGTSFHNFRGSTEIYGKMVSDEINTTKIVHILISFIQHPILLLIVGSFISLLLFIMKNVDVKIDRSN